MVNFHKLYFLQILEHCAVAAKVITFALILNQQLAASAEYQIEFQKKKKIHVVGHVVILVQFKAHTATNPGEILLIRTAD